MFSRGGKFGTPDLSMSSPSRLRTSHRLLAAIGVLMVLLTANAGLGWLQTRHAAAAVEGLAHDDFQRIELVAAVSEHANDVARTLIVLANAERAKRIFAYTKIDAAGRELDRAMQALALRIEGGANNPAHRTLAVALLHYRIAYQETADTIESEDREAAQASIVATSERELTALISAVKLLDAEERKATGLRIQALQRKLGHNQTLMLAAGGAALLLAAALGWWVATRVAAPMHDAARVARRFAQGDFAARMQQGGSGDLAEIGDAFVQLADEVNQREQALRQMIDIDPLTGLSQRQRFLDDHSAAVAQAAQSGSRALLMCLDIERLKSINALLGFDAGDAVLIAAAARLRGLAEAPGSVARLGGGTFVALYHLAAGESALQRGSAFRREFEHRLNWQSHTLDVAAATGLALCPDHAETLPELLRRAEQALFEAKRQRGTLAIYSPSVEAARLGHLSMLSDLQHAIDTDQLVPFLQPKLHLATGRVIGAEALVRWRHPERGWVPPGEFIPFAEQSGRIGSITWHMLTRCIELLATKLPGLHLAVNISTQDLRDNGFARRVGELLASHGVDAHRLVLEVTETGLLDSGAQPVSELQALRELGIGLAIDDFGTGQSSLAYLQKLPVAELKVDRSFVTGVHGDTRRAGLLRSIVRLGHSLGLTVTAEGLENAGELDCVRASGCDVVQGYHLGRPMPVDEFVRLHGAAPVAPPSSAAAPATA